MNIPHAKGQYRFLKYVISFENINGIRKDITMAAFVNKRETNESKDN